MAARRPDKVLEFMRVLWALDHAMQERSKAMGAQLGITSPQRLALRLIDQQPGITSGEVAELLHLDPSTLTGVLQRLETNGMLTRSRDKADGRKARLTITSQGSGLLGQHEHTVESIVRDALGIEKEKAIRKASAVIERLTAALVDSPPPSAKNAKKKRPATRRAP
jgi:DNA-binding MarR family transcriptional regulator